MSKAGVVVGFDDERPALTIETPAKNSVVIDDDAGAIRIRDQHGNTITMDAKGIEIDSANDLSIRARGNVVIGGRTVDIL